VCERETGLHLAGDSAISAIFKSPEGFQTEKIAGVLSPASMAGDEK